MSTANKLTYLNGTKQAIKDELNRFGADLTENDTFRSYSNVLNDIYDKLPKVSGNGSNFTLENVQNGKLDLFEMKGNTEQDSTSGINIFNINNSGSVSSEVIIGDNDYITCTYNNSSGSSIHYSNFFKNKTDLLQPSTNYLVVCEIKSVSGTGRIQPFTNASTGSIDTFHSSYYFNNLTAGQILILPVTTKATLETYDIRTLIIFDVGNSGSITFRLSLLTDTTITTDTFVYEKFTYGASPNPSYPQNVRVVTGNNTINVSGKNLFDKNLFDNFSQIIQYISIQLKPNTNYTLSSNIPTGSSNVSNLFLTNSTESATTNNNGVNPTNPRTITTLEDGIIRIGYRDNNDVLTDEKNTYWYMLNEGSTAKTYEPYQGSNYTLNLGTIELCKIGDYQDYIYKEDGKWYKHSEIGKVVLDGSNVAFTQKSGSFANTIWMTDTNYPNNFEILSNYFVGYTSIYPYDHDVEGIYLENNRIKCAFGLNSDLTTLQTTNNWLSTHNTTVYYVLETPTTTEITDTTLINQLEAIETKTGTNIFEVSNDNDVLPELVVSRLKELDKLS